MKKIKLKISELTNPELLSVETMKMLQGGNHCHVGGCSAGGQYGLCVDVNGYCTCWVEGGYGSTPDCWA